MGKKNETTKQPETLEELQVAYALAQEQIEKLEAAIAASQEEKEKLEAAFAAAQEEKEELANIVSELNAKLTEVEKQPKLKGAKPNPTVTIDKKTYEVLSGCIFKTVRYTKEALAEDKAICAELIEEELSEGILKLKEDK